MAHRQMDAQARSGELADAHQEPQAPQDVAGQRERQQPGDVAREIGELGVGGRLQHAEAHQPDEGDHVERPRAGPEHAVVEADGGDDGQEEQAARHTLVGILVAQSRREREVERDREQDDRQGPHGGIARDVGQGERAQERARRRRDRHGPHAREVDAAAPPIAERRRSGAEAALELVGGDRGQGIEASERERGHREQAAAAGDGVDEPGEERNGEQGEGEGHGGPALLKRFAHKPAETALVNAPLAVDMAAERPMLPVNDARENAAMEYRQLGRSGLKVSTLTMGTMTFGGKGPFAKVGDTDVAGARRQIDMCLAAGMNLFDTADVYSNGASEEICGEVFDGRRASVLIATKARFPMGDGPNDRGLSRHHLVNACEASLRRLRTDYIDLYQVHQWDGLTPLEETLEALDMLVRSGKVRYVGASNYSGWHLMKALGIAARQHLPAFVSQQIHYTLQAREAEQELVPISLDQGLGILVWSPLAGGLLSGKYRRNQETPQGRKLNEWTEPPVHDESRLYDIVDVIVDIAQKRDVSGAEVSLAWLLGRPAVASVIIGARTEEQLASNLRAADLVLSPEERARLDKVSQTPLAYPYWHQAQTANDRLGRADLSLIGPHLKA